MWDGRYMSVSSQLMATRDRRVRLLSEFIQGVRILKYCSWEHMAAEQVFVITASCLTVPFWHEHRTD